MITVKIMGGLGNQMFQYAIARSISLMTGEEITFDMSFMSNNAHEKYALNHCHVKEKNISDKSSFINKIKIKLYTILIPMNLNDKERLAKETKYQPFLNSIGIYCVTDGYIKINPHNGSKLLYGYFQSSKYFQKNAKIIRQELLIKDSVPIEIMKQIKKNNSVCVHIRRGDYTKLPGYLVCDINYYKKAIEIMKQKLGECKFFIFSDDINWSKEQLNNDNYFYVKTESACQDLKLMYNCKHFIISNSSFSWWACYLSDSTKKIVVSPDRWYNGSDKKNDLIMPEFILLDKDNAWKEKIRGVDER